MALNMQELMCWFLITLKLTETVERIILTRALRLPAESLESPWIISIREKLVQARQEYRSTPWATQSIYHVPTSLRDIDNTAYTPQTVSLGPYHRGRPALSEMDRHKWRALNNALDRTGHDICLYLNAARSLEKRARACYEAPLLISTDEFIECLVLDSIFILELFYGFYVGFESLGYHENDPVFAICNIAPSFKRDIIMLENQLPLFVLDHILALQLNYNPSLRIVAVLALNFLCHFSPADESLSDTLQFDPLLEANIRKGVHCLDVFRRHLLFASTKPTARSWIFHLMFYCNLLYMFFCNLQLAALNLACRLCICCCESNVRPVRDMRRFELIRCASQLHDAGIKFRCKKSNNFLDIKFTDGVLQIPRLFIDDITKSLFRNFIAFEQCHWKCHNEITTYIIFMDHLINSEADVKYLHDEGIIEHFLGSDREVADLFNQLCKDVVFDIDNCYLSKLSKDVDNYYNRRWNTWRASLIHKYFNNPWSIISLIAAAILLLLTFAQTFYGIYDYYKSN